MPDLNDRFLFEVRGLSKALRVARFTGQEGLSELFQIELTLLSDDDALPFEDVIGHPALLSVRTEGPHPRRIHGVVSRFAQGETRDQRTVYQATLVPRASRLRHLGGRRIFQDRSAPEILEEVLSLAGLISGEDFRLSLQRTYGRRARAAQQQEESDWAFLRRLMAEEGIFSLFEHAEDRHVLVLGDSPAATPQISGERAVAFRPPGGARTEGEAIHRFHYAEELGEGSFGRQREALEALQKTGDGEGACPRLAPGHRFTLSEHGREAFNRDYLVTHVEHEGVEPALMAVPAGAEARYENRFRCTPAELPFRPRGRAALRQGEAPSVGPHGSSSAGEDETESVERDLSIEVGHDHIESIGNNLSLSVGRAKTEEVGEDSSERVGRRRALSVGAKYTIEVGADMSTRVAASQVEQIELEKTVKVGSKISIQCGDTRVVIDRSGSVLIEGKSIEVKGDGPVKVVASQVMVTASGEVKVEATGKVEIKGSGPMSLEASGPVKVKGSNVGIN